MSETPINEYSLKMDLIIANLDPKDFGGYLCIAKNALGKAEGSIRLQGIIKKINNNFCRTTEPCILVNYKFNKSNVLNHRCSTFSITHNT